MGQKQIKYHNGQIYEYEIYDLVDQYDPRLRQPIPEHVFNGNEKYVAISMLETMSKHFGIGLAANQVGLNIRMFVAGSQGVGLAFFNPTIVSVEGETAFEEGCLSFPGLYLPIRRPEAVTIKFKDMYGEEREQRYTGLTARTILHEYDHLEGIVYTGLVSPIILERSKGKVKKNLKKLKTQREQIEKQEIIRKATERVVLEAKKKLQLDQEVTIDSGNTLISL